MEYNLNSLSSVLLCVCVSESQCLKLDDGTEDPENDPFTAKLSFEVRLTDEKHDFS